MKQAKIVLLVLLAKEGNKVALDQLFRHFNPQMRIFALALVPLSQVDDILQIVWLKMIKRIGALNDPEVFASWLYRSIRWEANDWHKQAYNRNKDENHTQIEHSFQAGIEEQTDIQEVDKSANDAFTIAVKKLSLLEQQVIQLYYLQEMQVSQIALALEIPIGTVKSRLHRARAALKQLLENENG